MRLIFDLQALQNGSRSRGIGRYVLHLFQGLAKQPELEVFGLLNAGLDEHFDSSRKLVADTIGTDHTLIFHPVVPTREIDDENHGRRIVSEAAYEQFLQSLDFDALIVGSLFEGFSDNTVISLKGGDYRKFVVLYDLIPLMNAEKFLGWDKIHRWYHERLDHLAKADKLLAISESARGEAVDQLGRKPGEVVAIGTATDNDIFNEQGEPDSRVPARLGIRRKFVMHASAFEERKNFEGLVRAFALLPAKIRRKHQLVLVGKGSEEAVGQIREVAREVGLEQDDVLFTGYVSDPDLAQLYRHCSLFVFPSFHEGFGLPALEAMCCGCPTIGSNRSSIPEVIGSTDLLFDPADAEDMAGRMEQILSSEKERDRVAAHARKQSQRFSWDTVADRARDAIRSARPRNGTPSLSLEQSVRNIGARAGDVQLDRTDLPKLARALSSNQQQAVAQVGTIAAAGRPQWRIEGPFDSSYSLALLNRETARALDDLGFEVALHSTEGPGDFPPNPHYLDMNPDLAEFHKRSEAKGRRSPDFVSRLLYPPRVSDMKGKVTALHHYAWEESGFPHDWAMDFNSSLTMMTCLSRHVEKIMVDAGVTVPMVTSGCGVDHWERVDPDPAFQVEARTFRFLHVSSCFPRKGADSLLEAYGAAFTASDDVSLVIKTFENPHNDIVDQLEEHRRRNSDYPHVVLIFEDLTEGQLKSLYQQCDVLVGPSCAEGYGLPFAEAMLSGLPVITTDWGGQLDFCNPGNSWLVDFDYEPAKSHFQLFSSVWARVKPEALVAALRNAWETSSGDRAAMAARGRQQLLDSHKWSDVAHRLAAAAAVLPKCKVGKPKIAWMTTWNSRCGVATYSAHLSGQLDLPVTIFAPKNEEHSEDGKNVIRCWKTGKDEEDYKAVFKQCLDKKSEALVIQFNYNFYNHAALTDLVRKCRRANIATAVFLHSTVDPGVPDPENYHLIHLREALRLCDRILVHSVADLNRLKAIGITDNVTLFPHGILDIAAPARKASRKKETVASYGFALPHKGLEQLVEAVAILHERGRRVRLRLVNSEYPVDVSRETVEGLKSLIEKFGLTDFVERHHDFLPDEESLKLIQGSDLAVFPYQATGESASGAVRYGMAAGVPVAVTPVPIFDDLGEAVFRFDGTDSTATAEGIERALDGLKEKAPDAIATLEAADRWRSQHRYSRVGRRLANMLAALVSQRS